MPDCFRIAHHFAPDSVRALAGHPAVAELRPIDLSRRWNLPTDVDIILALHAPVHSAEHEAPPPPGWPGSVRFVQTASAGTDGYPPWMFEGPLVATAAGTGASPIAEYALAAILMHEKRLPEMFLGEGEWTPQFELVHRPLGGLEGLTLGLLGLGQVGSRVARLGAAFGMIVIAHRRNRAASPAPNVALVDLDDLLARADHLVIAAPLTQETAGLIGSVALSRAKPNLHIVNIARGAIIDTAALTAALHEGRIAGATLDVTDPEPLPAGHPLWSAPNVRITPHMAWSSVDTPRRIFRLFIDNIGRFARGEPLINQVDPVVGNTSSTRGVRGETVPQ